MKTQSIILIFISFWLSSCFGSLNVLEGIADIGNSLSGVDEPSTSSSAYSKPESTQNSSGKKSGFENMFCLSRKR